MDKKRLSVAVVDDDKRIHQYLKQVVKIYADCITISALDGIEGLKLIRKLKPDLVFLDIEMPRMSGFEVLKQLKRDIMTSYIPVIMMTGRDDCATTESVTRFRANACLIKPCSERDIMMTIQNTLAPC